jgi:ubiquinone biosynthesis protein COQ9
MMIFMTGTAPSDLLRQRLLDAILPLAAGQGWTTASLMAAADAEGISPGELELACPNGVSDLLEALSRRAADAAGARLAGADVAAMKIREKVTAGVRAWLDYFEPIKPSVTRAAGSGASVLSGPKGVWAGADAIWAGLGDKSTDANWYTKRMTLSAVLASTFLAWLKTGDRAEVDAFLDRRIENVMQFEKLKGRVREATAKWPNPLDLMGKPRS